MKEKKERRPTKERSARPKGEGGGKKEEGEVAILTLLLLSPHPSAIQGKGASAAV